MMEHPRKRTLISFRIPYQTDQSIDPELHFAEREFGKDGPVYCSALPVADFC
jgi:hypothetical protein